MFKKQKWQARILSFLLVLIMAGQDCAALAARAEEGEAGVVKTVQEDTDTAGKDSGGKEADAAGKDSGGKETDTAGKTMKTKIPVHQREKRVKRIPVTIRRMIRG